MNILFAATDFPPMRGGISRYSHELAGALSGGFRMNVVVLAGGTRREDPLPNPAPYRLIRPPAIPLVELIAFFFIFPWIVYRFQIEAVLHTVWPTALISHFWRLLLPIPYFVSVHGSEFIDDTLSPRRRIKLLLRPWRNAALKAASGLFPVSRYGMQLLIDSGFSPEKIQIIPNAADPERFKPSSEIQETGRRQILLTVARLDLHKGHDRVLDAMALLKKKGICPVYRIAGEGDESERLDQLARSLGLEDQVEFLGFIPDKELPGIYASSDIFIMPSREMPGRGDLIEGFGIAFLEAGACGLPVIAGNSGGVPDAVADGETGILVDPNDPVQIADAIERLIVDENLAKRLGCAGRRRVETRLNWNQVGRNLLSAIRERLPARDR